MTDISDYPVGKGVLPSTGIPYVIVSVLLVAKASKVLTDVYPGQPIRNAGRAGLVRKDRNVIDQFYSFASTDRFQPNRETNLHRCRF